MLRRVEPPFEAWTGDAARTAAELPLDASVPAVPGAPGGAPAARKRLRQFVKQRLKGYAEARSEPRAPEEGHASGLSPYLHFGHLSIDEVVEAVLATTGRFTSDELRVHNRGKREGFFCDDADVNSFLDEALTWRDVGFNWHRARRADAAALETALPGWALQTLGAHAGDRRAHVYSLEELENGATHDPLWNAAQRELVATGTMHNYLRMLWGKKVLEWSASPARGLPRARAAQQQVRARRPRPELVHGDPVVLRPVRPALGAGAARVRRRALHVVRQHGAQVRREAVLPLRRDAADDRGRALGPHGLSAPGCFSRLIASLSAAARRP